MDDDKGTGLVFVNTDKGKAVHDFSNLNVSETTYETIKSLNPACWRSPKVHPKRKEFFERLDKESLIELINDCTKPTPRQQIRVLVVKCKSLAKRLLKPTRGGAN